MIRESTFKGLDPPTPLNRKKYNMVYICFKPPKMNFKDKLFFTFMRPPSPLLVSTPRP